MAHKPKLTTRNVREAFRGLREQLMAQHARMLKESGSNEIRGKNQDAQIRAMWAKDPDNPYAD